MRAIKEVSVVAAVAIAAMSCRAFAESVTVFDSRSAFTSVAGALLTDDYEDPGYAEFQDDASMNAVKGLTRYQTTFFQDFDEVIDFSGRHVYAGGFTAGSFQLDFTAASLGGSGVHAVGFDYINNLPMPYVAFVRFADGSSQNFTLHAAAFTLPPLPDFFGLTASVEITGTHIGLADGGATADNVFAMDDLSVSAPVPEPGASTLLGVGLAAFALVRPGRAGLVRERDEGIAVGVERRAEKAAVLYRWEPVRSERAQADLRLRPAAASPRRPRPTSAPAAGSGIGALEPNVTLSAKTN